MRRRRGLRSGWPGWHCALVWGLLLLFVTAPDIAAAKDKKQQQKKKKAAAEATQPGGEAGVPDTWYVTTLSEREGSVLGVHYWSKGPKFRAETIVEGHRIATIVNATRYYIVDVVSGTGIAIARSPKAMAEDANRGRPFGREWDDIVRDGGEKVRSREVGANSYDVFRVTDRSGRREATVTRSEPRIPLRVETFDRKTGKTSVITYAYWKRGIFISDSFFEPPQGLELAHLEYEQYLEKIGTGAIGPAPVLYETLLHGEQER